jgi:dTDP-4-amino-4,6-dideoxygalactose transaminase
MSVTSPVGARERYRDAAGTYDRERAAPSGLPEHVPFVALERGHAALAEELREAFERTLRSNGFILGEEVERFEAEFAEHCAVEHCIGVASGTAALMIALRAAGVGPGDEVIVPAHTFIASALAVLHVGARVVFCDVEADTGLIDADAARAAIGPATAAIVAVHLYGQMCDMEAIGELADRRGLLVVEDAAQSHGATCDGRPAGSTGHVAGFSFYPSKNLGALGDGGAICTRDAEIAERARRLRNLGQRRKGEHVDIGYNERLDGLQAALLRVKLAHLQSGNAARRRRAREYRAALLPGIQSHERPSTPSIYHLFPIRVEDRDASVRALASRGISTGVHYWPCAADHPALAGLATIPAEGLPVARAWAAEELSLPMFPELRDDEVRAVIEACRSLGWCRTDDESGCEQPGMEV